jgi:hypothetical protein
VYWVYVTAWASPDGLIQFREDIYQRDGFAPTASISSPVPQLQSSSVQKAASARTLDPMSDEPQ